MATFEDVYSERNEHAKLIIGGNKDPLSPDEILMHSKITVGGPGSDGEINIKNSLNVETIKLDGQYAKVTLGGGDIAGDINIKNGMGNGSDTIILSGARGDIIVGGTESDGDIIVKNSFNIETVRLDGQSGSMILGGGDISGDITIKNDKGIEVITLKSGAGGHDVGDITIKNASGTDTITLHGGQGDITVGGLGTNGEIIVKDNNGFDTMYLDAHDGISVGGWYTKGKIIVRNSSGDETVNLDGQGNITLGGGDDDGDITIKNSAGRETITMHGGEGDITVGGIESNGDIIVNDSDGVEKIKIKGSVGDIEFVNADFAEDFDIDGEVINSIEPGTVMTLDKEGKLVPCHNDYDSKVVGVIAGAGKYKPGVVMDKNGEHNRSPIAIMGKVYCKADAGRGVIEVGDLMTTSKMDGHAMKAVDKNRAFGSVIGKALKPLESGTSLIPILINLQ